MTKTMKIILEEDFLVPTDDGNIIFEPGDEIEVEYEDDEVSIDPEVAVEDEPALEPVIEPAADPMSNTGKPDPLSFAGNPETAAEEMPPEDLGLAAMAMEAPEDEEEVYIEDPTYQTIV